jgi:hypothetical protein
MEWSKLRQIARGKLKKENIFDGKLFEKAWVNSGIGRGQIACCCRMEMGKKNNSFSSFWLLMDEMKQSQSLCKSVRVYLIHLLLLSLFIIFFHITTII